MVNWIDTFAETQWVDVEHIREIAKDHKNYIHTVGFYIGYYEGYEVFAAEFNTNKTMRDWANVTYIPRGCIKSVDKPLA